MSGFEDKLNAILGDREAMGQIMALAQSLGKQEEQQEQPQQQVREDGYIPVWTQEESQPPVQPQPQPDLSSVLGGIDPKMMQMGMRLIEEYNRGDDRNAALLAALRPFVREERFAKVDRAIQIARLSRVIRVLFDAMKDKGGGAFV